MNIRKTFVTALVALSCLTTSAQDATVPQPTIQENIVMEDVFNPHWYFQLQGGAQETLGEVSFGSLLSPNFQFGVGYQFNKVLGTRLSFNTWQSKAGTEYGDVDFKWKWNYIAPMVDVTFDLTNLFGGYKPNRLVNVGIFAGIGANIGFNNDEAADAEVLMKRYLNVLYPGNKVTDMCNEYLWDGTKTRFTGRFGATIDFRVSDLMSIGAEVSANLLSDRYNSKKAGNADWYFNGLLSLKFNFGNTHTKRAVPKTPCEPQIIEKVVKEIVQVPVTPPTDKKVDEPLRRDVFFTIRSTQIVDEEMVKVREIAQYLNQHPEATVSITGYADRQTGNARINSDLSIKRARIVADTLKNQFGISATRIFTDARGDTEQPFEINEENRVSICIAK